MAWRGVAYLTRNSVIVKRVKPPDTQKAYGASDSHVNYSNSTKFSQLSRRIVFWIDLYSHAAYAASFIKHMRLFHP